MPAPPAFLVRPADLSRFIHRELIILLVLCGFAGAGFLATQAAAASNRRLQVADAEAWYQRGRAQLTAGRTTEAVVSLRRAVARQRDNWTYASASAEALVADGQRDAARQLLLLWRQQQADDPGVNAQLARLEAGAGGLATAVEYYESALYGRWPGATTDARLALRLELIQYLLAHGEKGRALSQIVALSANQPDVAAAHLQTARLFMEAGDAAGAMDRFQRALRLDRTNPEARTGAGAAAFTLEDYPRTIAYLSGADDERSRALARIATAVLASDPLLPQISLSEKRQRLTGAVDYARERLTACSTRTSDRVSAGVDGVTSLAQDLTTLHAQLSRRRSVPSDAIEPGLRLIFRALAATEGRCPPGDQDDIWRRVARHHEATAP